MRGEKQDVCFYLHRVSTRLDWSRLVSPPFCAMAAGWPMFSLDGLPRHETRRCEPTSETTGFCPFVIIVTFNILRSLLMMDFGRRDLFSTFQVLSFRKTALDFATATTFSITGRWVYSPDKVMNKLKCERSWVRLV